MTNNPFKLRSGNAVPFKQMGASPVKQDYHEVLEHHKKYKTDKLAKRKLAKRQAKKKVIKTVAKKALSRFIPYVGWGLLASDIYGVSKKMKSGKSFKRSLKSQFLGTD